MEKSLSHLENLFDSSDAEDSSSSDVEDSSLSNVEGSSMNQEAPRTADYDNLVSFSDKEHLSNVVVMVIALLFDSGKVCDVYNTGSCAGRKALIDLFHATSWKNFITAKFIMYNKSTDEIKLNDKYAIPLSKNEFEELMTGTKVAKSPNRVNGFVDDQTKISILDIAKTLQADAMGWNDFSFPVMIIARMMLTKIGPLVLFPGGKTAILKTEVQIYAFYLLLQNDSVTEKPTYEAYCNLVTNPSSCDPQEMSKNKNPSKTMTMTVGLLMNCPFAVIPGQNPWLSGITSHNSNFESSNSNDDLILKLVLNNNRASSLCVKICSDRCKGSKSALGPYYTAPTNTFKTYASVLRDVSKMPKDNHPQAVLDWISQHSVPMGCLIDSSGRREQSTSILTYAALFILGDQRSISDPLAMTSNTLDTNTQSSVLHEVEELNIKSPSKNTKQPLYFFSESIPSYSMVHPFSPNSTSINVSRLVQFNKTDKMGLFRLYRLEWKNPQSLDKLSRLLSLCRMLYLLTRLYNDKKISNDCYTESKKTLLSLLKYETSLPNYKELGITLLPLLNECQITEEEYNKVYVSTASEISDLNYKLPSKRTKRKTTTNSSQQNQKQPIQKKIRNGDTRRPAELPKPKGRPIPIQYPPKSRGKSNPLIHVSQQSTSVNSDQQLYSDTSDNETSFNVDDETLFNVDDKTSINVDDETSSSDESDMSLNEFFSSSSENGDGARRDNIVDAEDCSTRKSLVVLTTDEYQSTSIISLKTNVNELRLSIQHAYSTHNFIIDYYDVMKSMQIKVNGSTTLYFDTFLSKTKQQMALLVTEYNSLNQENCLEKLISLLNKFRDVALEADHLFMPFSHSFEEWIANNCDLSADTPTDAIVTIESSFLTLAKRVKYMNQHVSWLNHPIITH